MDLDYDNWPIVIFNEWIGYHLVIPFLVVKLIFNLINIIIFSKLAFQKTTIGFYLACLSISDILQGVFFIFEYKPLYYKMEAQASQSIIMCKLIYSNYFLYTTQFYPSWILAIISLDRVICMNNVRAINIARKRWLQVIIVLVPLFVLLVLNIDLIVGYNINQNRCTVTLVYFSSNLIEINDADGSNEVAQWFVSELKSMFALVLIPFIIMTTSNIISVIILFKSKTKIKHKVNKSQLQEIRFALTTIGQNIGFILFYLPQFIASCIVAVFLFNTHDYLNLNWLTKVILFINISMILYYLRHIFMTSQIFFYLFFNSVFRNEFLKLFKLDKIRFR